MSQHPVMDWNDIDAGVLEFWINNPLFPNSFLSTPFAQNFLQSQNNPLNAPMLPNDGLNMMPLHSTVHSHVLPVNVENMSQLPGMDWNDIDAGALEFWANNPLLLNSFLSTPFAQNFLQSQNSPLNAPMLPNDGLNMLPLHSTVPSHMLPVNVQGIQGAPIFNEANSHNAVPVDESDLSTVANESLDGGDTQANESTEGAASSGLTDSEFSALLHSLLHKDDSAAAEVNVEDVDKPKKNPAASGSATSATLPQRSQTVRRGCSIPSNCPVTGCGFVLPSQKELVSHMYEEHPGQKAFKCDSCDRLFMTPDNARFHMRHFHSTEEKFGCKFCNRRFRYRSVLREHVTAIHEKKKEHVCEVCGMQFGRGSTLWNHKHRLHERSLDGN